MMLHDDDDQLLVLSSKKKDISNISRMFVSLLIKKWIIRAAFLVLK